MTILLIKKKSLFKRYNEKTQYKLIKNKEINKQRNHNKICKYFTFKDRYLLSYLLIATSSMNMGVFMFRDVHSSTHLDESRVKLVDTANVFLRPQACQSLQLCLFLKTAYERLKQVLSEKR